MPFLIQGPPSIDQNPGSGPKNFRIEKRLPCQTNECNETLSTLSQYSSGRVHLAWRWFTLLCHSRLQMVPGVYLHWISYGQEPKWVNDQLDVGRNSGVIAAVHSEESVLFGVEDLHAGTFARDEVSDSVSFFFSAKIRKLKRSLNFYIFERRPRSSKHKQSWKQFFCETMPFTLLAENWYQIVSWNK